MDRSPTSEPIDATQSVVFVRNGRHYEGFALRYLVDGVAHYQGLHLPSRVSRVQPGYFRAARTLYQRLRRAGTINGRCGTDFCTLADCNAGVYFHRKALRERGFSIR